jgi:cardiolipin synthase
MPQHLPWLWLELGLGLLMLVTALHALMRQRDARSSAFWLALILFSPLIGVLLYLIFGVNFIRRRGARYRGLVGPAYDLPTPGHGAAFAEDEPMAMALDRISRFGFCAGNQVEVLVNGDEAMPAMLQAVEQANRSVWLCTYIFEVQGIGSQWIDALQRAKARGVEVRVMVDDAGTRYSWPSAVDELRRHGVPARRFMPSRLWVRLLTMNLRNHRKLLLVDGQVGFTGGMNIREGNMLKRKPRHAVRDLHFKVSGPVLAQMQQVFVEDWHFCSGELLPLQETLNCSDQGVRAMGIVDGPDEDLEVMPAALFAALCGARSRVWLLTPYFLPTPMLLAALKLCATRGVEVFIVTPGCNNIPPVGWAARTLYPELMESGCRVFETPLPFDHGKMLLVDQQWAIIGSTNWDPRSLRLNFEFNLACHGGGLVARLAAEFQARLAESRELRLEELQGDPALVRLRGALARLFMPLL